MFSGGVRGEDVTKVEPEEAGEGVTVTLESLNQQGKAKGPTRTFSGKPYERKK